MRKGDDRGVARGGVRGVRTPPPKVGRSGGGGPGVRCRGRRREVPKVWRREVPNFSVKRDFFRASRDIILTNRTKTLYLSPGDTFGWRT